MLRPRWVSWPRRSCRTVRPSGTTCDRCSATVSSLWWPATLTGDCAALCSPKWVAKLAQARPAWKLAQDRFNDVLGESAAARLRVTLLRIARDERLAALAD
jgi:hypothetical protein